MCIIIAKEKDKRLPTKEELTNCFTYNNDGAGFMYVDNGKVIIDKGYMSLKSFLKRYKNLCKQYNDFKDKALVIHCRIGTSSGNIPENTHPYPVSISERKLHATYIPCELGIAHNGIIHEYTPRDFNSSTNDTQEFIMKYVAPLYNNYKNFYKDKYIMSGISKITGSKFVIMNTSEELYYVGDFVTENGLKFSNTTFRPYSYNYGSYGGKTSNTYNWSNYYDDWYDYQYDKQKSSSSITSTYEIDNDIRIYDDELEFDDATMLYLQPGWFIDACGTCIEIKDTDMYVYNVYTREVYTDCGNGTLIKKYDDVIVYDENYEEVI